MRRCGMMRDKANALKLPVRGMPSKKLVYEFSNLKNKVLGSNFKLYLRNVLKRVPEYHAQIDLDVKVEGRSEDGVSGYAGNARFIAYPGEVPRVEVWCGGCGEDVVKVLDKLFKYVGGKRVE
jgi:hypothetical protein